MRGGICGMASIGRRKNASSYNRIRIARCVMKSIRWRIATIVILALLSAFALVPRNVTQRVYDPASGTMRDTAMLRVPINLGLDLKGGIHLALEIDESKGTVPDCHDA